MERTFLMIKPDGVQRGLVGEIIRRLEQKGFSMVAAKFMLITPELAAQHYAEHVDKPFFPDLQRFITSGPVMAMVWEGDEIIPLSRKLIGKTNCLEAEPGTIRGDYASHTRYNLIHGSDSPASAAREIAIFFPPSEVVDYVRSVQTWI
jgi:nucleoside-diphosphate kinase